MAENEIIDWSDCSLVEFKPNVQSGAPALEPGIIDANVLIYAVNTNAPQHLASRKLLESALDPAITLFVTSQILCEFYAVITNKADCSCLFIL